MKLLSRATALAAALLFPACMVWGDGVRPLDPALAFSTDRGVYSAGEDVTLFLANHSRQPLAYNLCHSVLEREAGGAWVRAEEQPRLRCEMVLHLLDPGSRARDSFPIPARSFSGDYRIRTRVEYLETGRAAERVTNTFQVGG